MVGDNGLVYAKLGYTQMQVNTAVTNHYTGYSLGMGYKQFITGGVYGFGELNYASYGKQTLSQSSTFLGHPLTVSVISSASMTNVLVGLGYRF